MAKIWDGKASFKYGDVDINFRWDISAMCELGDLRSMSMTDMIPELTNPKFGTIRDFLLVGANRFEEVANSRRRYSRDEAALWFEDMGIEKSLQLLTSAFEVPEKLTAQKKTDQEKIDQ